MIKGKTISILINYVTNFKLFYVRYRINGCKKFLSSLFNKNIYYYIITFCFHFYKLYFRDRKLKFYVKGNDWSDFEFLHILRLPQTYWSWYYFKIKHISKLAHLFCTVTNLYTLYLGNFRYSYSKKQWLAESDYTIGNISIKSLVLCPCLFNFKHLY